MGDSKTITFFLSFYLLKSSTSEINFFKTYYDNCLINSLNFIDRFVITVNYIKEINVHQFKRLHIS